MPRRRRGNGNRQPGTAPASQSSDSVPVLKPHPESQGDTDDPRRDGNESDGSVVSVVYSGKVSESDPFDDNRGDDGQPVNAQPPNAQSAEHIPIPARKVESAAAAASGAGGGRWKWNDDYEDYIQIRDGKVLCYRKYQTSGGSLSQAVGSPPPHVGSQLRRLMERSRATIDGSADSDATAVDDPEDGAEESEDPDETDSEEDEEEEQVANTFESPADPRFDVVTNPRRFFTVGRIFKTVWFEPEAKDIQPRRGDAAYPELCPAFHGHKPCGRTRWFVVVRKRLHHSLCFPITAYGGKGKSVNRAGGSRTQDYAVLYSATIEPPDPFPEEKIAKLPVAVIVEDGEHAISPLARLDCGRIYTVEDSVSVLKVGRVHPDSLGHLDAYFRESVG